MANLNYNSQAGRRVRSIAGGSDFLQAFTLLETMIAVALFGLVVAGTIEVFIMCNKFWHGTSLRIQTSQMAAKALSEMIGGYGTNKGIREASMIALQTNAYGHPRPFYDSYKYWETGNSPPSATDTWHYVHSPCAYGSDGSWRLFFSNSSDGVKCIDYNVKMRSLLFCPDTNQTTAARNRRILICNYVSAATITNDANGTIAVQLTIEKRDGVFIASNQANMFIKKRN